MLQSQEVSSSVPSEAKKSKNLSPYWWTVDPDLRFEFLEDDPTADYSDAELRAWVQLCRKGPYKSLNDLSDAQQFQIVKAHCMLCAYFDWEPTLDNLYKAEETSLSFDDFCTLLFTQLRKGNVIQLGTHFVLFEAA